MTSKLSAVAAAAESKALCDLIKSSDTSLLLAFLQRADLASIVNVQSEDGNYPVLLAARRGNVAALTALLDAGANPDTAFEGPGTFCGYRAAHFAASNDDVVSLQLLLSSDDTLIDPRSDDGWTPLHVAAYKGRRKALEWLTSHGADINAVTKTGNQSALLFAVSHGRPTDVRFLLRNGAKSEILTDSEGNTSLHHACCYTMCKLLDGKYDVPDVQLDVLVALLLWGNTDPSAKNTAGDVATRYWAAKLPSLQQFCLLLFSLRANLIRSKHEWNYLSVVSAKTDVFTTLGVDPEQAESLFKVSRAVDEERLIASMRVSQPAAPHAVWQTGAGSVTGPEDPSGGKCPFFQRGGVDTAVPAAGSYSPPSAYRHDPSGGKCPFFKGLPVENVRETRICPFSITYVRRHSSTIAVMGSCFLLGVAADRLLLKLQRCT